LIPWEQTDTPLARAFSAALQRSEAIGGPDADAAFTRTRQERGAMLLGTGIDPDELGAYTQTLCGAYGALFIETLGARDRPAAETLGQSDEAAEVLGEILRGAMIQAVLIGHYHRGYSEPSRSAAATGGPYAGDEPILFAAQVLRDVADLRDEQRAELTRDSVQWVLDLEADHLERAASSLGALGLHTIAEALRRTSAALRDTLESL
jgi:hypothetical protein